MNTSELAVRNNLSRRIESVKELNNGEIVVEVSVSQCRKKDEHDRVEKYVYFSQPADSVITKNIYVQAALDTATLTFLGIEEAVVGSKVRVLEASKEKEVKEKVKEKKPVKGKTTKDKVVKVEPVEEELDEFADLNSDLSEEGEEEEPSIMFDKSKTDHAAALSANIQAVLTKDWKKDEDQKTKVRALIAKLNSKIAVMKADGTILDSFNKFCRAELA